jgi:hypothetical protein
MIGGGRDAFDGLLVVSPRQRQMSGDRDMRVGLGRLIAIEIGCDERADLVGAVLLTRRLRETTPAKNR